MISCHFYEKERRNASFREKEKKRHLVAAMGLGVGGRNGRVEEEVTRGFGTS